MSSTTPEFWNKRYRAGKMPWDFQGVPKALQDFLKCSPGRGSGNVLIPGCGSAYEIKVFHDMKWNPLGIDFSEAAVERAKKNLRELADKVVFGDFFSYDFRSTKFDMIYERTFLCSMSPDFWSSYSKRVSSLLRDEGLLVGFFLYGDESDPPPYPLAKGQLKKILGNRFEQVEEKEVSDSLDIFAGKERWEVWKYL